MIKKRLAVVGLQTGDEGKGVRVVYYATRAVQKAQWRDGEPPAVWVERWQGGANAGHSARRGGVMYRLHQVPSGILIPGTYNLMGEGVYFNPREGMREIQELQRTLNVNPSNFGIASNAHVTLDYHVEEDRGDREKKNHTSTGRGIKPTAVDKAGRIGLRFEEFLDRDTFIQVLTERRFPKTFPTSLGSIERFVDSYQEQMEFLREFSVLQTSALKGNGNFKYGIGEGAQGFRLDQDRGLFPGTTSSNPAIVPFRTDLVLGIVKMYESSVGHDRPFVGQMKPELEGGVRDLWGERGTTTGLPRDLGWFDVVAVKHAIESCEVDYLVSTCGDRLEVMKDRGEIIKLVVAYDLDGKEHREWDKSFHNRTTLYRARPVFEEFEPWEKFVQDNGKLDPRAQAYIDRIQQLTGREFILHGTGQGVEDVIELKDAFELSRAA